MGKKSFRGGVHPKDNKALTAGKAVVPCPGAGEMLFFLDQHIGKPAAAQVKKGDAVFAGQILARADGFVSANVVSSCSGTVKAVEPRMGGEGAMHPCIVVTNDEAYSPLPGVGTPCDPETLTNQEILGKIKDAGIVGMGGAGFPTHVKLAPKNADAIDTVIGNGAECEPYITCDDALMRSGTQRVVGGMKLLLRLFPNAKGVIAIEKNKPEAIAAMEAAVAGEERLSVAALPVKYPQGGERNLIGVVTGRHLPAGRLPADFGCVVENVATLAAIYDAVCLGKPLMERYVTVSGDGVANPGIFSVKIGTPVSRILEAAGGLNPGANKLLSGGPMMGIALANADGPLCKNNNALTCLLEDGAEQAARQQTNCIRCGACVRACPEGLVPQRMALAVQRGDTAGFEKLYGMQCVFCGSCTYVCPAKRPLTQLFKQGKAAVMAERAKGAKK